jgi:hypothetical protein
MNFLVIAAILIGLLALVLLVVLLAVKHRRGEPLTTDYRALAVMGMLWVPVGVAIDNPGIWGMGLVFLIIGLANRHRWEEQRTWSDLSPLEQRTRLMLLAGLALLLGVGLAVFFWQRSMP